jgi:hypothetical protein
MKHYVVCDRRGKIVFVARAEPSADPRLQGGMMVQPKRGHLALELDLGSDLARQPPGEIARQYRVDTRSRKLVAVAKRG